MQPALAFSSTINGSSVAARSRKVVFKRYPRFALATVQKLCCPHNECDHDRSCSLLRCVGVGTVDLRAFDDDLTYCVGVNRLR
jgi:hypothetical protein